MPLDIKKKHMSRKRKPPVAKSLVKNSISAMFSAIEIHNKPVIEYRYETVVLLILNSWELLLKGYLYKFHKDIRIFQKDGKTKSFENCLHITNSKKGKGFNVAKENLESMYFYRNRVAHFYVEELNFIIYSLIAKNIVFYSNFLFENFEINLSKTSDLVLLPIGFKRPISPQDYLSNSSANQNSSKEVKEFINTITNASRRLNEAGIEETIFVDFKMNLVNVNRTTNADIIAGIDNTKENELVFNVSKAPKKIIASKNGEEIVVTRDKSKSSGAIYYESLDEGIFDEINNILDVNNLLSKGNNKFVFGESLYYRIYAERQFITYSIGNFELLTRTGMISLYAPFLFYLSRLPEKNIANILIDCFNKATHPKINNLVKISVLLGDETSQFFLRLFEKKYLNVIQKPNHYYTLKEITKSKKKNLILKSLNYTRNTKIEFSGDTYLVGDLIDNNSNTVNNLSNACLSFFNGNSKDRGIMRKFDFLAYGEALIEKKKGIFKELKKMEIRE